MITYLNLPFFFYKNFILDDNLKKLSCNYYSNDGMTLIHHYNKTKNSLIISKNNKINSFKLNGKIVYFPIKNTEILQRISNINECKFEKTRYTMSIVEVLDSNNKYISCYIIY